MGRTRILIADDNLIVRRGLTQMLSSEKDCEVCGEAASGEEAIRKACELLPDMILLDISMPGLSGLEAARLLHQRVPNAKILMVSQHDPARLLPRAIEAGAHACVDKARLGTDLLASIRKIEAASEGLRKTVGDGG